MDPWRRIVGGIQLANTISRGEIFESALLDEGQELGILLSCLLSVGEANVYQTEKWILYQFVGENCEGVGDRTVKLDLSIADQKLSRSHSCSKL
jgi:hypothetical protein